MPFSSTCPHCGKDFEHDDEKRHQREFYKHIVSCGELLKNDPSENQTPSQETGFDGPAPEPVNVPAQPEADDSTAAVLD